VRALGELAIHKDGRTIVLSVDAVKPENRYVGFVKI
jgi:hypothetical protein